VKLNIRGKLFAVSLALIGVSTLAGELYLRPAVEENLLDQIRGDLFTRLALVEHAASGQRDLERVHWDGLAHALGPRAHGRVTFIDAEGVVLGDSQVSLEGLATVENHRERPEVAAALAGGEGASTRNSATVHERLMYAAIPLGLPGGARGAARLAVPLDQVDAAIRKLRHILWAALGLALIVAVVLSSAAAQMLSRALGRIIEAAQRMASGDLEVRTRPSGSDEIAELGRALDVMAGNLASTLTALRTERDLLGVILESMQEGVLVLDQQSRMLLVNPALRSTFSLRADAEGRAALELIRNAELQSILERAGQGAAPITGEIEITGPKPRRLLVHAAPCRPAARARKGSWPSSST